MNHLQLAVLAIVVAFMARYPVYAQDQGQGTSNNWITDAPSDAERFQRIQKYLRGFDEAMHEV